LHLPPGLRQRTGGGRQSGPAGLPDPAPVPILKEKLVTSALGAIDLPDPAKLWRITWPSEVAVLLGYGCGREACERCQGREISHRMKAPPKGPIVFGPLRRLPLG
jgi:hypothetical protein